MHTHNQCRWLIGLTFLFGSQLGNAAELYRWTDAEGKVHYTDRVPVEYVEQGYSIMTEQGLTVHTIKPISAEEQVVNTEPETPTPSPEQEKRDRKLLMNYTDESEILTVRDRKIEELQALIHYTEKNGKQLELQYRDLTRQAGDVEKQGKAVPDEIVEKIAATNHKLKTFATNNAQRQQDIEQIRQQSERDLKRYRELTQGDQPPPPESEPEVVSTPPTPAQTLLIKHQIDQLETGITNQNRLQAKLEARFKEVFGEIQHHKSRGQAVPANLTQELNDLKLEIQQSYMNNLQNTSQLQALQQQLGQLNDG